MKYGLLGEKLGHSFSKEVHAYLADYNYQLFQVASGDFDAFMQAKDFTAINVTIPYKQAVIPYLTWIDPVAQKIGAINTIVNKGGDLYGYNTDYYGMLALIEKSKIQIKDKTVAILGTGGTSKTARAVMESLGAKQVLQVSRKVQPNVITYQTLYENQSAVQVIVNTTPCGMYPNIDEVAVDLTKFSNLQGVIDAVYNPLNSALVTTAKNLGIKAQGGLYMLVAQVVYASEIFLSTTYPKTTLDEVYNKIKAKKQNIVLIGMPSCGKTTLGKLLAQNMQREFIDTDAVAEDMAKKPIPQIFESEGEKIFREIESNAIKQTALLNGRVIATGGGAILNKNNVDALRQNGKIYFIDRPLNKLMPTSDRPLSTDTAKLEKLYKERYPLYKDASDVIIDADCTIEQTLQKILGDFYK